MHSVGREEIVYKISNIVREQNYPGFRSRRMLDMKLNMIRTMWSVIKRYP